MESHERPPRVSSAPARVVAEEPGGAPLPAVAEVVAPASESAEPSGIVIDPVSSDPPSCSGSETCKGQKQIIKKAQPEAVKQKVAQDEQNKESDDIMDNSENKSINLDIMNEDFSDDDLVEISQKRKNSEAVQSNTKPQKTVVKE
ncbi:hypothetical protein F2P81_010909 [Scophthalmus maximus]|uniref:Uncharacterized protein n=1 Tax=Scophthalmus maximus TaxID=52904 RepID=A0A6A4SZ32_SCOMX|nr:hypothetical protein F2P81_010909 [Scophthalmus maximus]